MERVMICMILATNFVGCHGVSGSRAGRVVTRVERVLLKMKLLGLGLVVMLN